MRVDGNAVSTSAIFADICSFSCLSLKRVRSAMCFLRYMWCCELLLFTGQQWVSLWRFTPTVQPFQSVGVSGEVTRTRSLSHSSQDKRLSRWYQHESVPPVFFQLNSCCRDLLEAAHTLSIITSFFTTVMYYYKTNQLSSCLFNSHHHGMIALHYS